MPKLKEGIAKKEHAVAVKYTPNEFIKLQKEANRLKMTVTGVVRAAAEEIISRKVTVRIGKDFVTMSLIDARTLLKELAEKVY